MGCILQKEKVYNATGQPNLKQQQENIENNNLIDQEQENEFKKQNQDIEVIDVDTLYQSPVGEINEETNNNTDQMEIKQKPLTQEQKFIEQAKNFFQQVEEMQLQINYILLDNQEKNDNNTIKDNIIDLDNIDFSQTKKKVVYINKGNNSQLIKSYFDNNKNWIVIDWNSKFTFLYSFKWTQFAHQIDWNLYKEEEQMVNHVKGAYDTYCTKCAMAQLLKDYEKKKFDSEFNSTHFYPKTYILEYGKKTYSEDEQEFLQKTQTEEIWISKPTDELGGHGIEIIQNLSEYRILFQRYKGLSQQYKPQIIQKYIENPLLLDNKKFDIRCFVLIASTKPFLVLFHQGFVYRSLKNYVSPQQNNDRSIHIANILLQKKDPLFQKKQNEVGWSMEKFANYLKDYYGLTANQIQDIDFKIKKIICYTVKCGLSKLKKLQGCFELFGVDVTLDNKFNPYLYEINENPGLTYDCQVEKELYPQLIFSSLDIIMDINKNKQQLTQRLQNDEINFKAFSVLINEAKGLSLI